MKIPKATRKFYFILIVVLLLGAVVLYGSCHFLGEQSEEELGQEVRVSLEQIKAQNEPKVILQNTDIYSYHGVDENGAEFTAFISENGVAEERNACKIAFNGNTLAEIDESGEIKKNEVSRDSDFVRYSRDYFFGNLENQTIEKTEHTDGNLIVTVLCDDGGKNIFTLNEKNLLILEFKRFADGKTYSFEATYEGLLLPEYANELFMYLKDNA